MRNLTCWRRRAAGMLLILVGLLATNMLGLRLYGGNHRVTMGEGVDRLLLDNFHHTEEDDRGIPYRWTRAESRISLYGFAVVSPLIFTFKAGGLPEAIPAPRPVALAVDGEPLLTFPVAASPRLYALVLPDAALHDGNLELTLATEATRVPPDERKLGVRLDWLSFTWFPWSLAFPAWHVLLVQWGIVGIVVVLARRLALPWRGMVALATLLVVVSGWMSGAVPLFAASWLVRLLAAGAAALLIFEVVSPRAAVWLLPASPSPRRDLRWLWAITLTALAIRMGGILYPLFDSHDWYIHLRRINDFVHGAFLIFDHPAEFSKKLTIVPPAPYLFYEPAMLFARNPIVAMQWVYTLFDSFTTLLVGLLVRRLGGSARASWFAALVVALFPLHFTALWWGFGPQVIGQFLTVLFALFLAPPPSAHPLPSSPGQGRRRAFFWPVAWCVFTVLLLSHIGAGILGGFLLVWYIVLVGIFQHRENPRWWKWGALMVSSGLAVTLLIYSIVLDMQLSGLASNPRLGWDDDDLFRVPWTLQSLYASFRPLGGGLPAFSLVFLAVKVHRFARWLVGAWAGSAGMFFVVDLLFGLQVRYAYFLLPMIIAGLAMLLDRLVRRHRMGWLVAGALVGLVGVAGLELWVEGIFFGVKPSLRGLTH